ncbi:MAG: SPFH/Band 7/PHB domain protein [Akkermansia sp.]|nr:SPFH/Band 7/PHB domain protein [Akkermansia sp.]
MDFIRTIPQGHESIVVMFGKPVKKCRSGLAMCIPFIQHFYNVNEERGWKHTCHASDGTLIEITEQISDLNEVPFITKDGVNVNVDVVCYWRINDVIKAVYAVDHLHRSLKEKILAEVRILVGERTLQQLLSDRSTLSQGIVTKIAGEVAKWGISVTSVDIQTIEMDEAVEAAMLQEMEAERKARAIKLETQGRVEAIQMEAEAQCKALMIKAEAQKAYVEELADIVSPKGALKILLSQQALDGYKVISETKGAKVYLPSNMTGVLNIKN